MFRTDKILQINKAIGAGVVSYNKQFSKGTINKLVIVMDNGFDDDDKITVRLQDEKNTLIMANVPLKALAAYSDVMQGYCGNTIMIDLGKIDAKENDIDIDLTLGSHTVDVVRNGYIIGLEEDGDEALHRISYEYTTDFERTIKGANKIFAFGVGMDVYANRLDTVVESKYQNSLSNTFVLTKLTEAMSLKEEALTDLALIYESEDEIGDDVEVTMNEGGAVSGLLIVREDYIVEEVSKDAIKQVQRKLERVENLERRKPHKAKALRRSGRIGKALEYRHMLRKMNFGVGRKRFN